MVVILQKKLHKPYEVANKLTGKNSMLPRKAQLKAQLTPYFPPSTKILINTEFSVFIYIILSIPNNDIIYEKNKVFLIPNNLINIPEVKYANISLNEEII